MSRTATRDVRAYLRAAEVAALAEIERQARLILRRRPSLGEFVMGMGAWFFVGADGEIRHETPRCARRLASFIDEFDETLCLTGHPMRFTANGPLIQEW